MPTSSSSLDNNTPPEKELMDSFLFPIGTIDATRKETLTPGPVYYPGDVLTRRTPGIDRPMASTFDHGAFQHSVNIERVNDSLRSNYPENSFDNYHGGLSTRLFAEDPISLSTAHSDPSFDILGGQHISPGKNINSLPFYPQNGFSTSFGHRNSLEQTSWTPSLSAPERGIESGPPLPYSFGYDYQDQSQIHRYQNLIDPRGLMNRSRTSYGKTQLSSEIDHNRAYDRYTTPRPFPHYHPEMVPAPPTIHADPKIIRTNVVHTQINQLGQSNSNFHKPPNPPMEVPTRPTSPKPRNELVESPESKSAYKKFLKDFKMRESESIIGAVIYASNQIQDVPDKIRWRAYIDVADTLKRNSRYEDARYFYETVCQKYPFLNQGWLEWSKMEEECGNLEKSLHILRQGARTNSYNEVLLTKAIKQHERLNNLSGAREMLGKLQEEAIDATWKTVLEGSLLESRAGNTDMARKLLAALMNKVSWYGPIYHEAFRLEEKAEYFERALAVVQKGLHELPRYGPLWFGLLRIMERKDMLEEANDWTTGEVMPLLRRTRAESQNAIRSISRELVWKIHFEQAQTEERAMEIVAVGRNVATGKSLSECRNELSVSARKSYTQSLMTCPLNLRWKVYLAGSRLELASGQISTAHVLLRQAKIEVPEKSKYHVYLECSRLEEYLGNINSARRILWVARREIKTEWKLYLEAVLVEARAGNIIGAIYLADRALSMDSGSGRLWALLVQLVHRCEWRNLVTGLESVCERKDVEDRIDCPEIIPPPEYKIPSKYTILCRALYVVPKSGEVWCEGARTLLNPLSSKYFDLGKAQKYLSFSIQFTPQYGDSFIEYIRLEMLMQVFLPRVLHLLGIPLHCFFSLMENFDVESDSSKCFSDISEVMKTAFRGSKIPQGISISEILLLVQRNFIDIGHCKDALSNVSIKNLTRRCVNADPNYGTAWFYCRSRPFDTPGAVIRSAFSMLVHELISAQSVYVSAIVVYVLRTVSNIPNKRHNAPVEPKGKFSVPEMEAWTTQIDLSNFGKEDTNEDFSLPPLVSVDEPSGTVFSSQDFVTALIRLNRAMYTRDCSQEEKRKILFGVDQISP